MLAIDASLKSATALRRVRGRPSGTPIYRSIKNQWHRDDKPSRSGWDARAVAASGRIGFVSELCAPGDAFPSPKAQRRRPPRRDQAFTAEKK
jgi:hypothetical protein